MILIINTMLLMALLSWISGSMSVDWVWWTNDPKGSEHWQIWDFIMVSHTKKIYYVVFIFVSFGSKILFIFLLLSTDFMAVPANNKKHCSVNRQKKICFTHSFFHALWTPNVRVPLFLTTRRECSNHAKVFYLN